MSLRTLLIATTIACGLAAPTATLAADLTPPERWTFSAPSGSNQTVAGSLDYQRSSASVTGTTLTIQTVAKSYTSYGKLTGNYLILQDIAVSDVGRPAFVIDLTSLKSSNASPVNLPGYYTACSQVTGDLCTDVNLDNLFYDADVTATLQPAVTAVPTLTEWAMMALGGALAAFAALTLNRRRQIA